MITIAVIVLLEVLEDVVIGGKGFENSPFSAMLKVIFGLTRNVTSAISSWGYLGVFVFMLLESSSLPIPSEVVLPFAGYLVSLGQINFWLTVLVATFAGIVGSLVDYWVGLMGVKVLAKRRFWGAILFNKSHLELAKGSSPSMTRR